MLASPTKGKIPKGYKKSRGGNEDNGNGKTSVALIIVSIVVSYYDTLREGSYIITL